ncbi:MAG: transglycosylase domain-containing protein [Clostridia bacterium]
MKKKANNLGFLLYSFVIYFSTFVICSTLILGAYIYIISLEDFTIKSVSYDSIPKIYDMNGTELYALYVGENLGTNRTQHTIAIENLPQHVKLAFVAAEDKRFYFHKGFDLVRISGAIVNAFKNHGNANQGASTITQQLVKIYSKDDEHTLKRKCRELGRSIKIEREMSKDEILEAYINIAYFGNNAYGIYDASYTFYGKSPKNLTIAEAASLAGKLKYPNSSNPFSDTKDYFYTRKDYVLSQMYANDFISKKDFENAKVEKLSLIQSTLSATYTPYTNLALNEAYNMIISYYQNKGKNISIEDAKAILRSANTKIYTNIDTTLQQNYYDKITTYLHDKNGLKVTFILTTKDGKVRGFFGDINNSNRAPGSTMKPICAYSPAFELGILTPDSNIVDAPFETGDFNPKNFDGSYKGNVSVKYAIANSLNTCAVRALDAVGLKASYSFIKKFGISSIKQSEMNRSVAIGCYGVSPFEMAQAYNTFNNDGGMVNLQLIDKIIVNGITIMPNILKTHVISSNANDMIKICLKEAVLNGSCTKAQIPNIETFAKSGTSDNNKDYWLCGFTPDITSVIWMGYDIPKQMPFSSTDSKTLWKELSNMYYK